jgi:hypothetical protein
LFQNHNYLDCVSNNMLVDDDFVGLSNFHSKFPSFYFIGHKLMFYLWNKNFIFEMMDLSWLLFYFGNVLNFTNLFESSIFILYDLVTTVFWFYIHFHFCDLNNIHIVLVNLFLFWNFKKSFKSFWGPSIFTIYDLVTTKC